MSRRIALADQLYGGNVESTVLAPLCPNMVIWLKIPKLTWFKLCPSPKKMHHINIDLSMKSNHFSQEMVHEGPFSDTRSSTNSTSTRPGEGAIYRYLSRQGKIAGDIHETKSSGLSLSWSPRALARGGSTKIALSRAGRWAIATDGNLFTKNAPMHA